MRTKRTCTLVEYRFAERAGALKVSRGEYLDREAEPLRASFRAGTSGLKYALGRRLHYRSLCRAVQLLGAQTEPSYRARPLTIVYVIYRVATRKLPRPGTLGRARQSFRNPIVISIAIRRHRHYRFLSKETPVFSRFFQAN